MTSTYLDIFDYLRSTSGLETASLVGNAARFTSVQAQGATALSVPVSGLNSVQVQLNMFDRIYVFDGSSTEVVQVGTAGAAPGSISIPLLAGTSLQYSHAVGVAWCSDGAHGSLADQIIDASDWIEKECYQSLLLATYTNEALEMPGIRASISNRGSLTFRPRHWPVISISALAIAMTPTSSTSYDTAQVTVGGNKRLCSIKNLVALPNQQQSQAALMVTDTPFDRNAEADIHITYQAGYAYNALPGDLKRAAILVTSDYIAKRHNPVGAPDIGDGSTRLSAVLRGDLSGESLNIKEARKILSKYRTEVY